jgi:hypothetical protein
VIDGPFAPRGDDADRARAAPNGALRSNPNLHRSKDGTASLQSHQSAINDYSQMEVEVAACLTTQQFHHDAQPILLVSQLQIDAFLLDLAHVRPKTRSLTAVPPPT